MRVDVRLFSYFRDYLPQGSNGGKARLDLPDNSDVRGIFKKLSLPVPLIDNDTNLPFIILINGQKASLDHTLEEGDAVSLYPPIAGG